ncbi:hypothetical protein PVK06_030757 [Gossypium arboreum]|uniref:Uncharacterized protein n=1 Tax=Gossypium arboreum TaxID=29729 RepID=A0ABR0NP73_GOSAR|nr:hypothetical protein PVK06_030757 [Gossypium arboreum]
MTETLSSPLSPLVIRVSASTKVTSNYPLPVLDGGLKASGLRSWMASRVRDENALQYISFHPPCSLSRSTDTSTSPATASSSLAASSGFRRSSYSQQKRKCYS